MSKNRNLDHLADGQKFGTKGLSVKREDVPLVTWAEEKSRKARLSFSGYVMLLIEEAKKKSEIEEGRELRRADAMRAKSL